MFNVRNVVVTSLKHFVSGKLLLFFIKLWSSCNCSWRLSTHHLECWKTS